VKSRRLRPSALILLSVLGLGVRFVHADTPSPDAALRRQTLRATACVRAEQGPTVTTAAGWLVDRPRRLLVTSQHAVAGAPAVRVTFVDAGDRTGRAGEPASVIRGRVVAEDVTRDLAVIELEQVPTDAEVLRLAPDPAHVGDRVGAADNPEAAAPWGWAWGAVQKVNPRTLTDRRSGRQVRAAVVEAWLRDPLTPGSSGGPVVNERGEVVGITTMASAADRRRVWCVSAEEIRHLLESARQAVDTRRSLTASRE
jgi:S1-C subfamily serine protease